MPAAEVEVTTSLVESLLRSQRPDLAERVVRPLAFGWDNVSFRVGDDLVARLPRRAMAAALVENEARWLPVLAPRLPIRVPVPLFVGEPAEGYPWRWELVPWIPGDPVTESADLDLGRAADDLGHFLRMLHSPAPPEAPANPFRGIPLDARDEVTRERIDQMSSTIDVGAARQVWETAVAVTPFHGEPVWLHGDLHPNNLLASDGRITGVIDFGDITSGDPATDLSIAWMLFPARLRSSFRECLGRVDDDTWGRARGWALSLAIAYLANSADHPAMSQIGSTTLARLLGEG